MKTSIYQAAIVSFFLPLVTSLIAIFMPVIQTTMNYIILTILIVNIVIYITMLTIYKKKKKQNAARLFILLNMLAFCLFFTFPLVKVFIDRTWLQVLLIIFFLICIVLGIYDQKKEIPLVFPEGDKERSKLTYIFYAIPVVIVFIGGGGNFIVVRELTNFFGDGYVTYLGGASLYALGCWFAFFFQSLFYQGFVKKGMWVK